MSEKSNIGILELDYRSFIEGYVPRETFLKIESYVDLLLWWNKKISLVSNNVNDVNIYMHIFDAMFLHQYMLNVVNFNNDVDRSIEKNIEKDGIFKIIKDYPVIINLNQNKSQSKSQGKGQNQIRTQSQSQNEVLNINIIDVGSGNGFLGIILNIIGYKNCHLVEINSKKSIFLKEVIRKLDLDARVYNVDIVKFTFENLILNNLNNLNNLKNRSKLGKINEIDNLNNSGDIGDITNKYYLIFKAFANLDKIIKNIQHMISNNTEILICKNISQINMEIKKAKEHWTFDYNIYNNNYDSRKILLRIYFQNCI